MLRVWPLIYPSFVRSSAAFCLTKNCNGCIFFCVVFGDIPPVIVDLLFQRPLIIVRSIIRIYVPARLLVIFFNHIE